MELQSWTYPLALLGVATIAYSVRAALRRSVLLAASFLFYASLQPRWLWLLAATIALAYIAALLISNANSRRQKKFYLWTAIALHLLPLLLTKYFCRSPEAASIPLGISFFTFQVIGYLSDVCTGRVVPEKKLTNFALFVTFFPLITAGPIERAESLLPQLRKLPGFSYDRAKVGAFLIFVGLFKKLVIADNLQDWVDVAYRSAQTQSGWSLYLATVFARYQIFADLSGYTDIALGSAAVLGIRLTQNFDRPFSAISISDHWKRWHISLSTWFRDYLYYPLIASPFGRLGLGFNLVVTFFILGIWHGGTWNFAVYGLLQGGMIVAHDKTREIRERTSHLIGLTRFPRLAQANKIFWTFGFLIALPTVFFKAENLDHSWLILKKIFSGISHLPAATDFDFLKASQPRPWLGIVFIILVFEVLQWMNAQGSLINWLNKKNVAIRWTTYLFCLMVFLTFANFGKVHDFLYRHF